MQDVPGTAPAAFLAFELVTELIETLTTKGVLSHVEVNNMFNRVLTSIGQTQKGPSQEATEILRKWIKSNQGLQ